MKTILVLGAGRSSAHLIRFLIEHAIAEAWHIRVGDLDIELAKQKTKSHPQSSVFQLDANNNSQVNEEVAKADLVISMLPAFMHVPVAKDCIQHGKHLITPSYVADDMWALDEAAKAKGILILNEMGVDPGIDHMSAMEIVHRLQAENAEIESFESFTGGLIAPESDNNPWNYKITWNPRNVVLAGYGGTARFQQNGSLKYIPYHRLFDRVTDVSLEGYGSFDGYANRDSLKYKKIYGLEQIPTIYRGTLRRGGFCKAWNALIQLGLTDDSFTLENPNQLTWRQLTASMVDGDVGSDLELRVKNYVQADETVMSKLTWLGIFENQPLNIQEGSPAVALQKCIETKWVLDPEDKDMIVMWHRFYYKKNGQRRELQSYLISIGEDPVYTAMSKTVGLPMAIAARLILRGEMPLTGIQLPVIPEIYVPVMKELAGFDISFVEKELNHN